MRQANAHPVPPTVRPVPILPAHSCPQPADPQGPPPPARWDPDIHPSFDWDYYVMCWPYILTYRSALEHVHGSVRFTPQSCSVCNTKLNTVCELLNGSVVLTPHWLLFISCVTTCLHGCCSTQVHLKTCLFEQVRSVHKECHRCQSLRVVWCKNINIEEIIHRIDLGS